MKYEYRGPQRPNGVDAQTAGSVLMEIHQRDGAIRRKAVVDEARPEDAPLHPAFEWDDKVAAEEYRLVQAGNLVRAVVMVSEPEKHETLPTVRAFVSVHDPEGEQPQHRFYRPVLESSAPEREEVIMRLRHELQNLRQRYVDLLEVDQALRQGFDELLDRAG